MEIQKDSAKIDSFDGDSVTKITSVVVKGGKSLLAPGVYTKIISIYFG